MTGNTERFAGMVGERSTVRFGSQFAGPIALIAGALALVLAVSTYVVTRGASGTAPAAHARMVHGTALQSLPLAARGPASAALGADDPAYAVSDGAALHADSPGQQLSLTFGSAGVQVNAGSTRVVLAPSAAGLGSRLASLPTSAPDAVRNRVLYQLPGLSAWYANGPLGLEQGFTFAHVPAGPAGGPLTVAIALGGNARPALSGGAVTFAHAGGPTLRYDGLVATDARGRLLHSWMQLDGRRLLLRVQARGASYPVRIDPLVEQAQLPVEDASSVALSQDGQTALVGRSSENGQEGAAYVFVRSGETWTQQAKLLPGDAKEDQFGTSVALSADGDTAVIGGPHYREEKGGAWVFTRSGETWTQQGEPISRTDDARFGSSVAIDGGGDTILVGSPNSVTTGGGEGLVGAAWVFTLSGETWSQQAELRPDNEAGKGQFGDSVALSGDGDTALIGAKGNETGAGAAWIYNRSGETWTQGQTLTPNEEMAEFGHFGQSVALSAGGTTAIVGGPGPEPARKNSLFTGDAWVFALSGETWTQQGPELKPDEQVQNQHFGAGVALSGDGDSALIGDSNSKHPGVWLFTRSGETWSLQGNKVATSGESVALDGEGSEGLTGGLKHTLVLAVQEASGSAPEFGRCVKLAAGLYENSSCTESGGGVYEWEPGAAKPRITLASTGTATFETVHGAKVTCAGVSGSGEFSGAKAIAGETLAFSGCESEGQQCTSAGAGAGEIDTSTLEAVLGVEKRASKAASSKLALDLAPTAGAEAFAQFACGADEVALRGSLIVPLTTNKMESSYTLKYSAAKGKQKPEHLAEASKDVLEESVDHGAYVQTGLTVTLTQTNEEAVEANSAF